MTKKKKAAARVRNLKGSKKIYDDLVRFNARLDSPDRICLDIPYKDGLVAVRDFLLETVQKINPILDEGTKSTSAQSVSGKNSRRKSH